VNHLSASGAAGLNRVKPLSLAIQITPPTSNSMSLM
jgi:hypothetical protein